VIRSGPRAGKQLGLGTSAPSGIGRDASRCELVLDDPAVSREHARIQWEHGQFVLYDLASANGTWVNNNRIQRQPLMDGDMVRIGDTTMVFKSVK
jgi:pSer/pThr/pTyr-binding forkhead associated (FHA) protein